MFRLLCPVHKIFSLFFQTLNALHHGIEFKSLITERCMTVPISDLQDFLWIPLQVYNSKNIPKIKDTLTLSTHTHTKNKRIEKKKKVLIKLVLSNFEISVIRYCEEVSLVQSFSGEGLPCLLGAMVPGSTGVLWKGFPFSLASFSHVRND